jgi:hypothetical protein
MLEFYASKLADTGQVVTDRVGLGWTLKVPEANVRWGFSFDDLDAAAALAGLGAYRMSNDIYVLARSQPSPPTITSSVRHLIRRAAQRLSRVARILRR